MATNYAPRTMMGNWVSTQEIVHTNGSICKLVIEKFNMGDENIGINTQGIGAEMFMFIIDNRTNYRLFPTMRKAINAAAKA